ncbi:TetR/AcrR family transcriptional regulator C-terminal domain-containing protein [[Kitasatospora] papulosa]|uniref:TetR/AcrR family transcriptional regulator C-terminal domain-containing protein n=1 Tax=Streptomyces TaxID=1883 RepID=UPI0034445EF6
MSDQQTPPSPDPEGPPAARRAQGAGRRGPGQRADLTRRKILDAAAQLDPRAVTLQAVASALGVDRKAVSYYVSGRDELLALLGAEALATQLKDLVVPGGDWREAIRVFAAGCRDALLQERSLGLYVKHLAGGALLKPAEGMVRVLLDAGFDDETAGRTLSLVTAVANEAARAQLLSDQFGQHPSQAEILRVLAESPETELTELRRILPDLRVMEAGRLDFELDVIIAGLDNWLGRPHDSAP